VTGPVALHGGGEFLPGDEPFLRAILGLAPVRGGVVRVAVVPTAAARGRPDLAAEHGVTAFRRVAAELGVVAEVEGVRVVDAASAADPGLAERLAAATLIHLPGGDPDLIPALYPGTAAWAAMQAAHADGAVLAGASAGAMALAGRTWTGQHVVPGLEVIPGVFVLPHADAASWPRVLARYAGLRPADLGLLGIGERTGVIVPPGAADGSAPWRVVGEGEARWLRAGEVDAGATLVVRDGETFLPTEHAA
jgi:cyanophycinase-like exopeptidase